MTCCWLAFATSVKSVTANGCWKYVFHSEKQPVAHSAFPFSGMRELVRMGDELKVYTVGQRRIPMTAEESVSVCAQEQRGNSRGYCPGRYALAPRHRRRHRKKKRTLGAQGTHQRDQPHQRSIRTKISAPALLDYH